MGVRQCVYVCVSQVQLAKVLELFLAQEAQGARTQHTKGGDFPVGCMQNVV